MKRIIILAVFFLALWGLYETFSTSPKEQVREKMEKLLESAEVEGKLNPVHAGMRANDLVKSLHNDLKVVYTVNDKERTLQGLEDIKSKLVIGLSRLKNFEFELLQNTIQIYGDTAEVRARIRGRGEIVDYMTRFSEIHRFEIDFIKAEGEWKLSRLKHIPYSN